MLREAPPHLRSKKLPLTDLEDVIALFDTPNVNTSYLPQAILLYQLEACTVKKSAVKLFDQSFAPETVEQVVKSI